MIMSMTIIYKYKNILSVILYLIHILFSSVKPNHFKYKVCEKVEQNKHVATLKSTLLDLLQHLFSVDKGHFVERVQSL